MDGPGMDGPGTDAARGEAGRAQERVESRPRHGRSRRQPYDACAAGPTTAEPALAPTTPARSTSPARAQRSSVPNPYDTCGQVLYVPRSLR